MLTKRRLDLRLATLVPRVAALLIAWLGACGNEVRHEPPPPPASGRAAPIVEFAGCSGATKPPQEVRCTLPAAPRVIQLFVSASSVPLVEIDGAPASARTTPTIAERGWTVAVNVPPTATAMSVRDADAEPSDAAWTMTFDRIAPTPTVDAIEAKVPDMNTPGRTPALLKAIAELEGAAPTLTASERHRALRLAMVLALDAGAPERALGLGRLALQDALAQSELFHVIEIGEVLLHATADMEEHDWVLQLLEIGGGAAGDGQHEVRLLYARANRAFQRGDIGDALDDWRRSESLARRLGLVSDELTAAGKRVAHLALIGDSTEAQWVLERMLVLVVGRPREAACTDAQVLIGAAWNLLVRRMLGDESVDPARLLDQVAAYFAPDGGCDVGDNPMLRYALHQLQLDLARNALTKGDEAGARAALDPLRQVEMAEGQRGWFTFIEADLALRSGNPAQALQLTRGFDRTVADQPVLAWRTALLRADAHSARSDDANALVEALAAESVLDRASGQLAPDQGREGMAAAFDDSAARAIGLQLDKGDVQGAASTARRARARRLRPIGSVASIASLSSEARGRYQAARARAHELSTKLADDLTQAWRLPAEERARASREHIELQDGVRAAMKEADALLREGTPAEAATVRPEPGELTLVYHPLREGWVAFAISDRRIDVHRFALPSELRGEAASAVLLAPFSDAIGTAARLRVLAVGELLPTRMHTMPWNGEPLVMTKPVAYGVDLEGSVGPAPQEQTALVVADPATRVEGLGRLPNAAAEGSAVQERLQALGWDVQLLAGEAAVHSDVVAALSRVGWLHYAGHGIGAGHSGWQSGLPLAGEAWLDVPDILSAPRVPSAIVLSACDTGGTAKSRGASMQVATAFVLAGARFVVAAQGEVSDASAQRFSAALYGAAEGDLRGPELVRRAILALHEAGEPMSTWAGFHVWVR